jgi:Fe-S-cluster formation regulator IscX/YfhJ
MKTLSETLADERDRCRRLMNDYGRIGTAGAFAAALVQQAITKADYATRTGQFTTMRQALMELQRFDDLPPSQQAPAAFSPMVRRVGDRAIERSMARAPAYAFTARTPDSLGLRAATC